MKRDYLWHYREFGYAIVRNVFSKDEIQELAGAFDRIYAQGEAYRTSFRHQNVFFKLATDENLGKIVRMVQWPSYFDDVMARFRSDPRMLEIVEPLIGSDLKQIINQLHWKPPGAAHVEFGYHQDIRFRRPRTAYREPGSSYVQTGIAVDPHTRENGAILVYPGSHRLGEVSIENGGRVMDSSADAEQLAALGLDPSKVVELELEPGDVGLWHLNLIHGSGPNHASHDRRLYINGYVSAANCDRGEWAFRNGVPCRLGDPVLVHYEQLHQRADPHYVD